MPEVSMTWAIFGEMDRILFPHGCLIFNKNEEDQLLIANDEGYRYAVAILELYCGITTLEEFKLFEEYAGFDCPYLCIKIENKY